MDSLDFWNFDLDQEQEEAVPNTTCKSLMRIRQEDVVRLPKLVQGILVGGNILVMIFSGCGNLAALIIVLKSKAPKISTKYFLAFLAISDLLLTATAPPTEIGKMMNDFNSWVFGKLLCKLIPVLQLIGATMSAICLMAIAVERNLLIVRAMSNSNIMDTWQTWIAPIVAVAIIIIPIGCGLPTLWYYRHVSFAAIRSTPSPMNRLTTTTSFPSSTTPATPHLLLPYVGKTIKNETCEVRYFCMRTTFDNRNIAHYGVTGGTYFCLLACFLICYISIYRFVKKHGNFRKELEQQQNNIRQQQQGNLTSIQDTRILAAERHRKTLRLILGLILLHIVCRFPNWIFLVIVNVVVVPTNEGTMTLLESLHLLSSINSALNPFLYVIWNHSLRATSDQDGRLKDTFRLCGSRRHRQWFHNLCKSICTCCRYKRKDIEQPGALSSDPEMSSSKRWWRSPRLYKVKQGNDIIPSTSTQRVFYSDKSWM